MIKRILIIASLMTIAGIPVLAQTVDWDKGSLGGPVVKRSTSPPTDNSSSRERSGSNNSSRDSSSSSSGSSQRRDLPPNVVFENGKYSPAPSFRWLNNKQNDLRVEPIPGAPYYDHPNVVWAENGKARPATGFRWLNYNPKDFRVVGNPGTPYAGHPHVVWAEEKGIVEPEWGYDWVSKTPGVNGDYRVVGNPGTPYAGHPNVMWVQGGQVSPEPGYHWVSPTPGVNGDYSVEPDESYREPVVPAERKQEFAELESRRTDIKKSLTALRTRQRALMIQPNPSANMMQLAEVKYEIKNAVSQVNTINILISDRLRQSPQ